MAKIEITSIVEGGKKVGKLIKDNQKEILAGMGVAKTGIKLLKENTGNKKENQIIKKKLSYREQMYKKYENEILPKLDSQNRLELFQYIDDIEQYVQQLKEEEKRGNKLKKPLYEKKIKKWDSLLMQIRNKMSTKDYLEFIKIYNDPHYQSNYFKGFEGHVEKFKTYIGNKENDAFLKYLEKTTGRDIEKIKKDFMIIE